MVRVTDHPNMTLDVYRGRKTTIQQQQQSTHTGFTARNLSFIAQILFLKMLLIAKSPGHSLEEI